MKNILLFGLCATLVLLYSACGEDDMPELPYEVPETYDFANVNYSGQLQRLGMLSEMKAYMKTSQEGATLQRSVLEAMYANDAENAGWVGDYEASKQLRSKTFESEQPSFDALLVALAEASTSVVDGSAGQAGLVESLDGSKTYLLGADGLDHAQLIEKGLMGACFYYQATGVYFSPTRMDVDNEVTVPGEGTAMEHHFDEAFGYFGVEPDFPANLNHLLFWGSYSQQRNEILGSNQKMMDAFLLGRAAISNQDLSTRDEAIMEIRDQWELIAVGSAIHYLNASIEQFEDMAIRGHQLSEAIGFVYSLQFNPEASISLIQVRELLTLIGGDHDFANMNLYDAEVTRLEEAKEKLVAYYGLESVEDAL